MNDSLEQMNSGEKTRPASLADLVDTRPKLAFSESFPRETLVKIAVIAGLLVWMNWWQLRILFSVWEHNPNWSHGFIIPFFSIYLLYARRDELLSAKRRVCPWAWTLVIMSIAAIAVSFYPIRTYWFCHLGMVALLFSLVLYLGGWQIIKVTWLPILFLVFAMPLPTMLYERIALPLQELAAMVSANVLAFCGVEIEVSASSLKITSLSGVKHPLTVAEACSGVRSLMAYLSLGVAWAYLENRPVWQRIILALSAGPIAILCNVIRVIITCTMFVIDEPQFGQKFMHEFTGMLMLGPAILMFWGLCKLLQCLFVEVDDEPEDSDAPDSSTEGAQS